MSLFDDDEQRRRTGKRTAWQQEQEQRWNDQFRRRWVEMLEKPDSELPEWAIRIKRNRERRLGRG